MGFWFWPEVNVDNAATCGVPSHYHAKFQSRGAVRRWVITVLADFSPFLRDGERIPSATLQTELHNSIIAAANPVLWYTDALRRFKCGRFKSSGVENRGQFSHFWSPPSNSERVWQNAERDYRVASLRPRLWYTFDERPVHGGGD